MNKELKPCPFYEVEFELKTIPLWPGDNRFEIINKAKKDLIESTNIEMSPGEMKVLDDFLFRCWQMGWLRKYEEKQNETFL